MGILSLDRVTVVHDGRATLEGFSLTVKPGEKVAVCGASGSGKSTALRCVLGFVALDSGLVTVGGQAVTAKSAWSVRRSVGYVAQEPPLWPGTVRSVLAEPFGFAANAHLRFDEDEAEALLQQFGMGGEYLERSTQNLSGGEKQRVALTASLLLRRSLYLMDEPTSALDPEHTARVAGYLAGREDLTVLVATHDDGAFAGWDRTVSMDGEGGAWGG